MLRVALVAYGIIHQALYHPPGAASIANINDRTSRSPSPAPKNSPSGASTVDRPSKVPLMRRPLRFASVARLSGIRIRTAVTAAGPVRLAMVALLFAPGDTVALTVAA